MTFPRWWRSNRLRLEEPNPTGSGRRQQCLQRPFALPPSRSRCPLVLREKNKFARNFQASAQQSIRGGFADDSEPSKLGAGEKENRARGIVRGFSENCP